MVSALAGLDVDDFPHDAAEEGKKLPICLYAVFLSAFGPTQKNDLLAGRSNERTTAVQGKE